VVRIHSADLFVTMYCVYIGSILTNMDEVRQRLGYCPQFDALCSLLTTDEHLRIYARLRGIANHDVAAVSYSCKFGTLSNCTPLAVGASVILYLK